MAGPAALAPVQLSQPLGLTGPAQTAFGQVANSPLGAVMDTGWVIYGSLLIVGAFLVFDPRRAPARSSS
ncbi:hypothetical protein [Streptomyces phaeochromogenes]